MSKQIEALKMAIKALQNISKSLTEKQVWFSSDVYDAIQACKEALEPEIELADTISVEDYQKLREQPVEVIASGQLRFKKKKYLYAYIDTRFGKIAFSTEWSKNSAMPLLGKIEVQDE